MWVVVESMRIDIGRYACLGFLEDVMSLLSNEVHTVDQGNHKNSSALGSPLSSTASCTLNLLN